MTETVTIDLRINGEVHSLEVETKRTLLEVQRKDLLLIFKEAVNNAAKYARCTRLEVSFRRCGDRIVLIGADDGVGFDVEQRGSGSGLNNMRSRANALGGECRIEASPGGGTRVVVEMPMTT